MRKLALLSTLILASSAASAQDWELVPSPDPDSFHNTIFSIAGSASNDVWTVGTFQKFDSAAGGVRGENLLMHWNGASWQHHALPVPGNSGDDALEDVVSLSPNNVFAGGYYQHGGVTKPQLLHWNGSSWTSQGVPSVCDNGSVACFKAFSPNNVWAGGNLSDGVSDSTYLLHYNGSTWTPVPVLPAGVSSCYILDMDGSASNDMWAVGSFVAPGQGNNSLVMHYDGNAWTRIPIPDNPFSGSGTARYIKVLGPDDIVVTVDAFPGSIRLLRYDGTNWRLISTPPGISNSFNSVVLSERDIYHWSNSGIYHFNGSTWRVADSIEQPGSPTTWNSAMLPDGRLWVCGFSYESASRSRTMVYRATGSLGLPVVQRKAPAVQVFPNPADGRFTIRLEGLQQESVRAEIYDMSGRPVWQKTIVPYADQTELKVELSAPAGLYYLDINNGALTQRLTIIR